MRFRLLCIALTLLICSEAAALAQCDDKSQQNAADEAGIKGDLVGASKYATQADKERSQKKLEEAAAKAKNSVGTDGRTTSCPWQSLDQERPRLSGRSVIGRGLCCFIPPPVRFRHMRAAVVGHLFARSM
jgi:hypothetical protein